MHFRESPFKNPAAKGFTSRVQDEGGLEDFVNKAYAVQAKL